MIERALEKDITRKSLRSLLSNADSAIKKIVNVFGSWEAIDSELAKKIVSTLCEEGNISRSIAENYISALIKLGFSNAQKTGKLK